MLLYHTQQAASGTSAALIHAPPGGGYLPTTTLRLSREGSARSPLAFRHGDKGAVAVRRRLDYL